MAAAARRGVDLELDQIAVGVDGVRADAAHTDHARATGRGIVDLVFFNKPNDLAVSVHSASSVPQGRQPAPQLHVVATDHVSFFEDPATLSVLAEVVSS